MAMLSLVRGISAVGSASPWHGGGHGFESRMLHYSYSFTILVTPRLKDMLIQSACPLCVIAVFTGLFVLCCINCRADSHSDRNSHAHPKREIVQPTAECNSAHHADTYAEWKTIRPQNSHTSHTGSSQLFFMLVSIFSAQCEPSLQMWYLTPNGTMYNHTTDKKGVPV